MKTSAKKVPGFYFVYPFLHNYNKILNIILMISHSIFIFWYIFTIFMNFFFVSSMKCICKTATNNSFWE